MTQLAEPGADVAARRQDPDSGRRRRNPLMVVLLAAMVILGGYYTLILSSGALTSSPKVPLGRAPGVAAAPDLTLQLKVQDVDLTNRSMNLSLMPIPHAGLVGSKPGEMSRSLRIEIVSGGTTTSVVTYPGKSIVDPTAVTLELDRGDAAYPFDKPFADFRLSVQDDEAGSSVPFAISVENSARPWTMAGSVGEPVVDDGRTLYPVVLTGHRGTLNIALVLFYVLAILLTTLMAVVTIGTALLTRELDFANVIWLSATMLSFPTLRSAMPGAPPIGTGLDFVFFFPCMCLIALLLVWTGGYLLWRESETLRRFERRMATAESSTPE